jgi:hypothetical protein
VKSYHRRLDRWAIWAAVLGVACIFTGLVWSTVYLSVHVLCLERLGCTLLGVFVGLMLAGYLSVPSTDVVRRG